MISRDEAIEIATEYIEGRIQLGEGSYVVVTEAPGVFVVEWKTVPVERGPDFDARVTVDRESGGVVDMMVGS